MIGDAPSSEFGDLAVGVESSTRRTGDTNLEFASTLEDHDTAVIDTTDVAPFPLELARKRSRGKGGAGGRQNSGPSTPTGLLSDDELDAVEREYPDGITAIQIVDLFADRGVRFSEASFRKYVQQGLLPRSRRVGRKGKHRGSLGVYPAKTVRRINSVKQLMAEGFTIEEIQERFLRYTDVIEGLEEGFVELFSLLEDELAGATVETRDRRAIKRDFSDAKRASKDLMRTLEALAERVSETKDKQSRGIGAAESAEDLL